MRKWIKGFISVLSILFVCYIVASGEDVVYKVTYAILCGLCLCLFLFLLWLPEQRKRWNSKEYRNKEKEKWDHKVPNAWMNKFILKANWMDNIYNEICLTYLNKKYNHTIPMMEQVLLLMHNESLRDLQRPFLRCNVYVDGVNVRLAFLSDRLRVRELETVALRRTRNASSSAQPDYWQYMGVYKIMLKEYMNYDEAQLNAMIEELQCKPLPKHTYKSPYKSWYHRYMARTESHQEDMKMGFGRGILMLLGAFADIIAIVSILLLPVILLNEWLHFNTVTSSIEHENLFFVFLVVCVALPRLIYCYVRYNKPTAFELTYKKQHGDH